jgi:hypothetical protein
MGNCFLLYLKEGILTVCQPLNNREMAENQISVTLKPEQRELLEALAEDQGVPPASLAAKLIVDGLNDELERVNRINVYWKMRLKRANNT